MTTDLHTARDGHVVDDADVEEVAERIFGLYVGAMLTCMIDIGHRTGLFATLAEQGGTSDDIARRAGLDERYVREWLGAMVTGGVVAYEPVAAVHTLPPTHAACLTGAHAKNLAPVSRMHTHLATHVGAVARAFRAGGGVPYERYRPEFTDVMDELGRATFDELLVDGWLPLADGLVQRLEAGARVADVGCGTGHAVVRMAQAYPASTFVGYDIADDALARARSDAAAEGLGNVRFERMDVTELSVAERFDVVFAFDAIHDLAAPGVVLRRIHDALAQSGLLFMVDIDAASDLGGNLDHPLAPMLYAISVLHCMTISLAAGGAGLGAVWGRQRAQQMLADAGFVDVTVHDAVDDPFNVIYVARRS